MNRKHLAITSLLAAVTLIPLSLVALGAASESDRTFAAKVSQGGMYEVEAGKVAEQKATAQDVKNLAYTDVHDHELVNKELKRIAAASRLDIAGKLNSDFQGRINKLKAVPAAEFDRAYITDMAQIHHKDEKLFAQESEEGSGDFKAFAAKTDLIVKRHIGLLHGTDVK